MRLRLRLRLPQKQGTAGQSRAHATPTPVCPPSRMRIEILACMLACLLACLHACMRGRRLLPSPVDTASKPESNTHLYHETARTSPSCGSPRPVIVALTRSLLRFRPDTIQIVAVSRKSQSGSQAGRSCCALSSALLYVRVCWPSQNSSGSC